MKFPSPYERSGSGVRKPRFYVRKCYNGNWIVGKTGFGLVKEWPATDPEARAKARAWRAKAMELIKAQAAQGGAA